MGSLISEQIVYEKAFYPFNDGTIVLPIRTREYLDRYSDEFKRLTIERKLCNLGFALTRGLNLYEVFMDDINYHEGTPGYAGYEDNVKQVLYDYIDYLREVERGSTALLFENEKVILKQLVRLLEEEILLRYNERSGDQYKEYIVYFESVPMDYQEIIKRFEEKGFPEYKQACLDYLLTSQESVGKATVDKYCIQGLNRWKELLPKLSGYDLYFHEDLVFPGDESYVYAYNNIQKDHPEKQLILKVPPEPWSGNILHSKLVLLSLNPGYVEHLNKSLANMFRPQMAEAIMEDKRKILSMSGSQFDDYEPTRILGEYYWRKKLIPLGIAAYGEQQKEEIFSKVAVCQYIAYTSLESPDLKELLPSQLFTKMVLLHLTTTDKDVKFLVLRAVSKWKALMGEGLWNYLKANDRLLISENYRNQSLTEKNLGAENYRMIIEHLRNA